MPDLEPILLHGGQGGPDTIPSTGSQSVTSVSRKSPSCQGFNKLTAAMTRHVRQACALSLCAGARTHCDMKLRFSVMTCVLSLVLRANNLLTGPICARDIFYAEPSGQDGNWKRRLARIVQSKELAGVLLHQRSTAPPKKNGCLARSGLLHQGPHTGELSGEAGQTKVASAGQTLQTHACWGLSKMIAFGMTCACYSWQSP